jgi:hypothetical protein
MPHLSGGGGAIEYYTSRKKFTQNLIPWCSNSDRSLLLEVPEIAESALRPGVSAIDPLS